MIWKSFQSTGVECQLLEQIEGNPGGKSMKFLQSEKLPAEEHAAFEKDLEGNQKQVDRAFAKLLVIQWILGILCSCLISPLAWEGTSSSLHLHVAAAVILGGLIVFPPIFLARKLPGALITRMFIACGQVLFSGLLIHLMAGRIEAHFHIFVSMALLAAYKDYRVFIPATLIVAADHLVRGFLWPQSVFGVLTVIPWRAFEHALWVLFEVAGLTYLINKSLGQMKKVASLQGELERKSRQLEVEVMQRTAELGESHDFQESILNSIDFPVSVIDSAGRIEFGNKEFWNLSRKIASEDSYIQIGSSYEELWEQDDPGKLKKSLQRIATGEARHYTGEHELADASEKTHFDISAKPILFGGQRCVAIIHVDLTEKLGRQQEIAATRAAWMTSPLQLALIDVESKELVAVNETLLDGLGQSREHLLGSKLVDFVVEEYSAALSSLLEEVSNAKTDADAEENDELRALDCRLSRSDHSLLPTRLSFKRLTLGKANVIAVYGTDMTATENLAQSLADKRSQIVIGELASGLYENNQVDVELLGENLEEIKESANQLADFSQKLSEAQAKQGQEPVDLEQLKEEFKLDRTVGKISSNATESAASLGRLVRSYEAVGSLGKQGFSAPEMVDLLAIIDDAKAATQARWSIANFEITDDSSETIEIEGQGSELRFAVVQLILNACDGILKRAELLEPEYRGEIRLDVQSTDEFALISIEDNGAKLENEDENSTFAERPRLRDCREAILAFNGDFKFENCGEAGVVIKARLPKRPGGDGQNEQTATPLLFPAVAPIPSFQNV